MQIRSNTEYEEKGEKKEEKTEVKRSEEITNTFESYARTLRKIPNKELYKQYLIDVAKQKENKKKGITQTEADYIKARKLWTDVVAKTDEMNEVESKKHNIKGKVIQRLKDMGATDPLQLYEDCMTYLKENSVITVTFKPDFLTKGLTDFQLLNMWEKDKRDSSTYNLKREKTEKALFEFLKDDEFKNTFLTNRQALPRYGALLPESLLNLSTTSMIFCNCLI